MTKSEVVDAVKGKENPFAHVLPWWCPWWLFALIFEGIDLFLCLA